MSELGALQAWIAARLVVLVCGVSVCGIGLLSFVGYLLQLVPLYAWLGTPPQAINSDTVSVLSGIALMVMALSRRVWKC